jgi:hypothetical protein
MNSCLKNGMFNDDRRMPNDIKKWSSEHVKQFLEEHMNNLSYDENNIKKIHYQNVNGYSFLPS